MALQFHTHGLRKKANIDKEYRVDTEFVVGNSENSIDE